MKTRKSLLKRVKITGRKKILKRPLQQGHFKAKQSGDTMRKKRKEKQASRTERKLIKKTLVNF